MKPKEEKRETKEKYFTGKSDVLMPTTRLDQFANLSTVFLFDVFQVFYWNILVYEEYNN